MSNSENDGFFLMFYLSLKLYRYDGHILLTYTIRRSDSILQGKNTLISCI